MFMKKIGFIDYFLDEWHANHLPGWIESATNGQMKVCYAWGEIDSPREDGRTNQAWAAEYGVTLCGSIQEVIAQSDYLMVLSPDNPERHEDLCRLPLASGKPVYVDKTFAVGLEDAVRIIDNAAAHHTPFFSCSALRYADEIKGHGPVELMESRGPGMAGTYLIHQAEPIFLLMGKAGRVLAIGDADKPTLVYDFGGGRRAIVNFYGWDTDFSARLRLADGTVKAYTVESDFFAGLTEAIIAFFKTGEVPFHHSQTLSVMAMLQAGHQAAAHPGTWITVA